jgi:hypothetical protein
MTVLSDLTHLRTLPTDFAWVPHQAPYKWIWNKGAKVSLLQVPYMVAETCCFGDIHLLLRHHDYSGLTMSSKALCATQRARLLANIDAYAQASCQGTANNGQACKTQQHWVTAAGGDTSQHAGSVIAEVAAAGATCSSVVKV